ncbi:hypothetical protein ACHAQA_003288 [Verticillium albo-atrum]
MASHIRTLLRLQPAQTTIRQASLAAAAATRPYHATLAARLPYKDTQDRESLKPSGTEGTKSGRDSDTGDLAAAFDPSVTSPEAAKEANSGNEGLDVSGASQDVSKPRGDEKSGQEKPKEVRKGGASGRGSPAKKGSPGA